MGGVFLYYEGMNRVINGDFRDYDIPKEAFIISDPPYNQGYHYNSYSDRLAPAEYRALLFTAFADKKSAIVLYPEETINIFGGGTLGTCEQVVSWVYPSNTAKQHRLVTWWNTKPDMRAVGQPYRNPTDKRIAKRIAEGKEARLYDWWEINQVKNVSKAKAGNPHTCPIPYELAERIVLITTKPGDLVVDPFCGSGTVLLAAKNNGREYLGFDIDANYCHYAQNLLA